MEGSPRDLRHAWHRHDPVRELSSRDPGLDQPASRGKTATTQPAMITPPAVLTVISLFPIPYTGTIKVGHSSWRGNRWMAGIEKGLHLSPRKDRDWIQAIVSQTQQWPLAGLVCLEPGPYPGRCSS